MRIYVNLPQKKLDCLSFLSGFYWSCYDVPLFGGVILCHLESISRL